jgi:hypothetical protein
LFGLDREVERPALARGQPLADQRLDVRALMTDDDDRTLDAKLPGRPERMRVPLPAASRMATVFTRTKLRDRSPATKLARAVGSSRLADRSRRRRRS